MSESAWSSEMQETKTAETFYRNVEKKRESRVVVLTSGDRANSRLNRIVSCGLYKKFHSKRNILNSFNNSGSGCGR